MNIRRANKFLTGDRDDIIGIYNPHMQWIIDDEGMAKNAMPKIFTDNMKWIDWMVTLISFLKYQTRSNVIPLNYIVCYNVNPIVRNNPNFLEYYAYITLLQGTMFTNDTAKFHLYKIRLI